MKTETRYDGNGLKYVRNEDGSIDVHMSEDAYDYMVLEKYCLSTELGIRDDGDTVCVMDMDDDTHGYPLEDLPNRKGDFDSLMTEEEFREYWDNEHPARPCEDCRL